MKYAMFKFASVMVLPCIPILTRSGTTCHLSLALPLFSWSIVKSVHTIIAPAYLDNNLGEAVMSTDCPAKPGNHMPRFSGVLFYFFK